MGMLEFHAANELGNLVPGTERCRPVGNREAGIVAGNQSTGNDQEKSPAGENDGEAVKPGIVVGCDGFQSSAPWVLHQFCSTGLRAVYQANAAPLKPKPA
jgi:hypothetical protein